MPPWLQKQNHQLIFGGWSFTTINQNCAGIQYINRTPTCTIGDNYRRHRRWLKGCEAQYDNSSYHYHYKNIYCFMQGQNHLQIKTKSV